MNFQYGLTVKHGWIEAFQERARIHLQDLILEHGIEVDVRYRLSNDKTKMTGFYFILEEYPDVHYESLEELRRVLKNKLFSVNYHAIQKSTIHF